MNPQEREEIMKTEETLQFQLSLLKMMSRLEHPRPHIPAPKEVARREETMAAMVERVITARPNSH